MKELTNLEIIKLYGDCIKELKTRNLIRTSNVVGELGEYLAIDYYCRTPGLLDLQLAQVGTEFFDAKNNNEERYSIKSTTRKNTGVFHGLNLREFSEQEDQKFEYLIIVSFDELYSVLRIIEVPWESFIKFKKWHKRMNAWYITISKKLLSESKIVFDFDQNLV